MDELTVEAIREKIREQKRILKSARADAKIAIKEIYDLRRAAVSLKIDSETNRLKLWWAGFLTSLLEKINL